MLNLAQIKRTSLASSFPFCAFFNSSRRLPKHDFNLCEMVRLKDDLLANNGARIVSPAPASSRLKSPGCDLINLNIFLLAVNTINISRRNTRSESRAMIKKKSGMKVRPRKNTRCARREKNTRKMSSRRREASRLEKMAN